MTAIETTTPIDTPRRPPGLADALRTACGVAVWLVLIAVLAVEATPHVRGIGFWLGLRYAVIAPACAGVALATSLAHAASIRRTQRPRRVLAGLVVALAAAVLCGIRAVGASGAVAAASPAVVAVGVADVLLVPRLTTRASRSRLRVLALSLLGIVEVAALIAALAADRAVPAGPGGAAFDVPRAQFDVDHKYVDLPGGARVHYVDEGQGPTLLFLHGNPAWSFQWRELIRDLRSSYRCVAPDYPGFGLSTAPPGFGFTPREESRVIEDFVDRLRLRDVTLVMQDWGGPIGLGLAERRPELVRRVVLGSTWAWRTTTAEPRGKFSVVAGGPIGEFVQVNFNGFAKLAVREGIVHPVPAEVAKYYELPFRRLEARGIAAFYPGQITDAADYFAELENGLSRLADKPALIFWALGDAGFPRSDLVRFEQAFPRHRTVLFPEAHHFFFEDETGAVVREIGAFVAADEDRGNR